jgi:hypothetical protein
MAEVTPETMLVLTDDPKWGEINTTRCKLLLLEIQRKQLGVEFNNRCNDLDNKLAETREKLNNLTAVQKSASKTPSKTSNGKLIRSESQYERPPTIPVKDETSAQIATSKDPIIKSSPFSFGVSAASSAVFPPPYPYSSAFVFGTPPLEKSEKS